MSPERVVKEMQWCENAGIKELFFYDDTFAVKKQRVLDICSLYKKYNLSIKWDIRTRVNTVDEELLRAIKSANCQRIHFGVESAVPRVLKELNKGITVEQVEKAFDLCHRIGIKTLAYFMMGNPTETKEDVKETLALAKRIKPDFMQMTILSPFPATKIYDKAIAEGYLKSDVWKEYASTIDPNFRPPIWDAIYTREELEKQLRWFYTRFYLTPKFIMDMVLEVRNLGQFKMYAKGGLSLLRMALVPDSKRKCS
jgi:radical SAM superfamily enzyme YgiQ (UPF0313 family)